uniref:MarR family winged helix-turn-helix transcriptional regulator n=1 Tax=Marinobacterium profundum TaxID=1714300 RepID=UPI0008333047|nr:MarR family winged helix-turn-helix transcriptional regulator [Marinobacterium profundum]
MLESPVGEALHRLLHAYKRAMRQSFQAHGIDLAISHIRTLKVIHYHLRSKQPCTAQLIVTRLERDKAQIARLLQDLLAAELIEKHPNPEDRRSQILRLTQAGSAVLERIAHAEQDAGLQMAQGLSHEEMQSFIRLANAMTGNLAAPPG